MPMGNAKMSLVIVSKKEFRGMQSELHTNPVDHCCRETVVPCSTMACNMVDDKETGGKEGCATVGGPVSVKFVLKECGGGRDAIRHDQCFINRCKVTAADDLEPYSLCKILKLKDIFACHGLKNLSHINKVIPELYIILINKSDVSLSPVGRSRSRFLLP